MIFKTFDSDIDKISAKWGIFGKSFNDIGNAIIGRISDINKGFQATDDLVGSIKNSDSIWKRLYPSKETIQSQLIDVDSVIPKIDSDNFDFDNWINRLNEVDKKVKSNKVSWQDFSNSLDDNQKWIAKWGEETQGTIRTQEGLIKANQAARDAAIAHNAALKQQTLSAKAGQVALKGLAIAGNMIAGMAISFAISKAIEGIDYLIHREERLEEAFNNAKESAQSFRDEMKNIQKESAETASSANKIADSYAKLVQGVNPYTNENVSLSNEQYEEFLNLNEQLADLFPSLTQNYDENGNAILGLGGSIETVTGKIAALVEQQERLAKADLKKNLENYVNGDDENGGQLDVISGYADKLEKEKDKVKDFKKELKTILNGGTDDQDYLNQKSLNKAKKYYKDKFGLTDEELKQATSRETNFLGEGVYRLDFSKLEIDEDRKTQILNSYNTFLKELEGNVQTTQAELDNANQEMSDQMMIWVEDMPVFDDNQSMQTAITKMVGSIDWSSLGITDLEGAKQYIQQTIFNPISKALDSPDDKLEVTNALSKLFTLDLSKMPVEEAKKAIDGFLTTIMNILNQGVPDAEKKTLDDMYKMFGFGDVKNLQKQYDNAITKTKDKFKSEPIDITPYQEALDDEYQKIKDWGLEDYADKIKNDTIQSVFGNVDMDKRTIITWSDELKQTYADALASWDYDPEVGSIDTVFGGSSRFGEELNGVGWEVAFTPILPDGTFLSQDTVYDYINTILEEAYADDGKVTEDELVKIDAQGRQIGNTFVQGIFAGIDDSQNYDNNGNWAETVGKLMHFSGDFGAVQIAKDAIEKAKKQEADFDWDSWFKENSINTQEEIDRWNEIAESAANAADARKKYTEGEEGNETDNLSGKSFKQIWNSLGTGTDEESKKVAEEKENLLKLAEAGQLTEKAFKNSSIADTFTKAGYSIEEATTYLNKFVIKSDQLNGMETGIKSISEALGQKKENLKSKKTKDQGISADTLAGFDDSIKSLKSWKNFEETLGDGASSMKKCRKEANKLATEWVNSNNFLAQLDETNKDYYISTLDNMGVANAEQVVMKALNEYTKPQIQLKEELKNKNIDLANSTWDDITATDTFKNATGNARKALIDLYAQENILSKSDLGLQDKVDMLRDFIQKSLGASVATKIAAKAFHNLAKASRAGMSTGEYEQIYNESYIDEFNKTMKKIDVEVKPSDSSDNKNSKSGKDKSNKDKSSSSKQTINWIERALSRISSTLDLVKAKAENLFGTNSLKTLQKQEASLKSQYNILKKQYDYQNKAEKKYLAKANSIKISSNKKTNASLKKAVQEGRISGSLKQLIATYGEKTATKIQNYQDYWDKAQDQKKSKEETKKSMRENISDRYQLHIDDADARKSRNEAKLENLTTAKAKEKVLKDTKTQIATSYNYQIKQAQLEKDDVKVAELRAQKAKELRETEIQILQNYADEYEASVTLLENQSSSTTNVSKKNSLLQQSLTPLKQQYDKLIAIAAKEGDITEKKRLQVEYQNKLNAKLKEQFDNVADGYEFTQTQYQQRTDSINNRISLSEAQGRYVGEAFYTNLMNNQKNSQASIVAERDALITARADKLKNGLSIDSNEYREMTKKIWELDRSIEQGETDIANSAKQIREAKYAIDEFKQSRIDERNNEAEFYKTILEYKDAFDDNGVITSEGLGILTSDVFEIQNNLSKVEEYKKSLADLDAQYKRGDVGYDEFITKNQSLTESMRDAQSQVYSLKDAIKSLIEDGLNAQLDALNELIDKYKKTLDTAKDLRDYNKTVTEQTKNIATIQKQLEALNGDTSEEGRAKIQKLQVSLEDAKQQLEDTEYDKRISDIENIFDDLAEDYQDFIDDQMDHVDELVDKIISAITVNSGISGEKILELSKLFGFELSDSLKNFIEHSNNTTDSDAGDEANKKIKEDVESSKLQSQDYDKQSKKESDSVSGATHKNTSTTNKTPSPGTLQQETAILSSGKIQQWHQPSYGDIGHKATLEKGATYYNYALAGGIKKGDKGQTTKSNHSVTIKNVDNNGNVQIKSKNKNLNGAWIPKKKLTYLQGFSQGGRVGDLQNIIRMNGDDGITINTLKKGEEVLTPYNADLFDKFVDFLPDLVDYNNNLIDMVRPVNVPSGNIKTGDLTLNIDNIELPNVTDPKEFSEGLITAMQQDKNLQRFWGDATAGSLKNNMSSIYKY